MMMMVMMAIMHWYYSLSMQAQEKMPSYKNVSRGLGNGYFKRIQFVKIKNKSLVTLPPHLLYFPFKYQGTNSPWSSPAQEGIPCIPHNYSCYWPQIHQPESNLGYLAETLRNVKPVSLASVEPHHYQFCVVHRRFHPKSNHSRAR